MPSTSMVVEPPEGASSGVPARGRTLVDTALVLRAQAGDQDAVAELAAQIRPTAQRFASRFLSDPVRGEDVAQVALMKAITRLGDVRSPEAFPAWLLRIVRNECLNELSRQKHAQLPLSLLAEEGTQIQAPAGGDDDPEEALLRGQLQELVRRVAATLPAHHRQTLIMRALEDRTYEEISQALDVPVPVARVWYFRARQRFRSAFVTMMVARRGVPALCQEMGEPIAAMIEGTLPEADRPQIQDHLAGCHICRQTEDELRNTAFRSPTRAMILGLGLLRLGWRLPRHVRRGASQASRASGTAVKLAVTGAGGAVLATSVGAAAPPATTVGTTVTAPSVAGPSAPAAGAAGAASPATVAKPGVAAPTAPQPLPGLPDLFSDGGVASLLQQVHGLSANVPQGVPSPPATPPGPAGAVTSTIGGLGQTPPAPAAPQRLP